MVVTKKQERQIKKQGYADIGGLPRNTYWTPDGRQVQAIASMREYNVKDGDGEVIGSGTRDANLDKGWLTSPPQDPKPYCTGCDKWHNTEEEVILCISKKEEDAKKWEEYARKEQNKEQSVVIDRVDTLEVDMLEVKGGISEILKLLKGKDNG
jgi:hypothetical protein|tara:strand:+ start:5800 stop:6258 length:459 start_codon:yes stop_codon:yes gene_type:complete